MKYGRQLSTISLLGLAIALTASCSQDFDFEKAYDGKTFTEKKVIYEDAFVKEFCPGSSIATDHNWGFTELPTVEEIESRGMTRSANCNSNQWADTYVVPGAISDAEKNYVYEYIRKYSTQPSIDINYTNFFVQQIWKGIDQYIANNGGAVIGGNQMNQLKVGSPNAIDEVNNFNNADGSIMLMENSGTTYFGYQNSTDGGKIYDVKNTDYKIFSIAGYGTYVGFDFRANGYNPNEQVNGDGVFTDWIVKIVVAAPKSGATTPSESEDDGTPVSMATMRVMCEDLGSIGDFDFNDVVFDVTYITTKKAKITIQAAGGTLPLYIGDLGNEVHEKFGVPLGTMVNTMDNCKPGIVTGNVVTITNLPSFEIAVKSTNPNDIPVYVSNGDEIAELSANIGGATQKICVPANVSWTNERYGISLYYPGFIDWVHDSGHKFWEAPESNEEVDVAPPLEGEDVVWEEKEDEKIEFQSWQNCFIYKDQVATDKLKNGMKLLLYCKLRVAPWQTPFIRVRAGSCGNEIVSYSGLQAGADGYEDTYLLVVPNIAKKLEKELKDKNQTELLTIEGAYFEIKSMRVARNASGKENL